MRFPNHKKEKNFHPKNYNKKKNFPFFIQFFFCLFLSSFMNFSLFLLFFRRFSYFRENDDAEGKYFNLNLYWIVVNSGENLPDEYFNIDLNPNTILLRST